MAFLGMGAMEILVVLVLAFVLLGPRKMVDLARLFGRAIGEIKRITEELPRLSLDETDASSDGMFSKSVPSNPVPGAELVDESGNSSASAEDVAPVTFRQAGSVELSKKAPEEEPDGGNSQ